MPLTAQDLYQALDNLGQNFDLEATTLIVLGKPVSHTLFEIAEDGNALHFVPDED